MHNKKEIAEIISGWTKKEAGQGMMLCKTPEDIIIEIDNGQSVIMSDECGEPISYCRLHSWDNQNWIEVGSLVVNEKYRKKGFGSKTILEAINMAYELFPDAKIFALTENPISKSVFEKLGGKQISKTELPEEVWNLCHEENKVCKHWEIFPRCYCVAFSLNHLINHGK